jgi:FdhD protein
LYVGKIRLRWGENLKLAKSISITMRPPGHDAELAVGFLWTEGIISDVGDILTIESCEKPAPGKTHRNVVLNRRSSRCRFIRSCRQYNFAA